jgi:hypothetical protein
MAVGFGGLALVVGLVLWAVNRRKETAEDLSAAAEQSEHDSNHMA